MSSPTLFKPFVDEIMQHVKKDLKKYHVVMLLTKGGITDLQKAIDKIIDCSYLPVSFVIIGIGDSNFKEMEVLDSDRMFLRHSENRQAIRDIVQFVPFNKYKNDMVKFREEMLKELPFQIEQYYNLVYDGDTFRRPSLYSPEKQEDSNKAKKTSKKIEEVQVLFEKVIDKINDVDKINNKEINIIENKKKNKDNEGVF